MQKDQTKIYNIKQRDRRKIYNIMRKTTGKLIKLTIKIVIGPHSLCLLYTVTDKQGNIYQIQVTHRLSKCVLHSNGQLSSIYQIQVTHRLTKCVLHSNGQLGNKYQIQVTHRLTYCDFSSDSVWYKSLEKN